MARYGQKFKERVVARLLPPESSPVEAVSQTVGISVTTLERWRAEVLANPSGNEVRHWTPAARLEAVIATAAMNQSARSGWCRVSRECRADSGAQAMRGRRLQLLDLWRRAERGRLRQGWDTAAAAAGSSRS
jgi:transposase-like protein